LRPLVAAYPLAMAFSLVYAGEHYFSDILLGWIYTIATVLAARAAIGWWAARQARRAPAARPVPAPSPAYASAKGRAGPARPL
jgi:membrane-associated phospholipid phosphatase